MRILCIDDEPLMLKMLEKAIKKARPDADVTAHKKQSELLEDADKSKWTKEELLSLISICTG